MAQPKSRKATGVGVRAKLEWASQHLKSLDSEIRPWADSHRGCIAGQVHEGGHTHLYRARYVPDIPPHWPLLIGDSVHNVRVALDHLAWQLVLASGTYPTRKTAFPIRLQPKRAVIRPHVTKPIRREVAVVQPDSPKHWLHVLSELDNVDKHRTVLVVSAANTGARQGQSAGAVKLLGRRLELNKPVGRVSYARPESEIQPDVHFPVGISFDERVVRDVNVALVIRQMIDWINRELIPRFQPFIADLSPLPPDHWRRPPNPMPL